jgi:cell division protein FtsI/penicillin-binding protein 2
MMASLLVFGLILAIRLVYLQVVKHGYYAAKATSEQTLKDQIPARRGELYVHDGAGISPLALNQTLYVVEADPSQMTDKADAAAKIASVLGGSSADYVKKLDAGTRYAKLADRVSAANSDALKKLKVKGLWTKQAAYRTYPEGSLAAQVIGFVNNNGAGQYGIEQYLNDQLAGVPGQLSGKTDTNGVPIATADNVSTPAQDGKGYLLTIDRNIQAMVEQKLEAQVKAVKAKSGSVVIMDPSTGAIKAMATYPTFDPNNYSRTTDYSAFMNQAVTSQYEPGSGVKTFTVATGLDQNKITPDSTYDDPGCYKIDDRNVCNAAGDKSGKGKTMTVVLRDSLNTGVVHILRLLGGNPDKFTLGGKKLLYDYFTKHFGFGVRTGIEQANEASGAINTPSNAAGNDVNYANMSFGQGMSVTMVQMVAAMGAVANGGKLYQPRLVDGEMKADGTVAQVQPKLSRDHVISPKAAQELNQMLQVVVQHGSGYRVYENKDNKNYKIAGKTGTAQIPKPDGTGYIDGANIGSFTGFAPADSPKFVMMVQINQPGVAGYAEFTTVPLFGDICGWLFKYYAIPPSS